LTTRHDRLKPAIGGRGYFALSFGAIVGSGWIIVLGDWFASAGPGGAMVGLTAGGVTMALVALCYGELAARFPTAGGEVLYSRAAFGPRMGFLVGWALTLYAIGSCAFEAVAFGTLARGLIPSLALPDAYHVGAWPVPWDGLLLGSCAAACIAGVHLRGARDAIRAQNIVTFGFIGIIGVLIVVGLWRGDSANLEPLFAGASIGSAAMGVGGMFALSAFFLTGWQAAIHAIEERDAETPVHTAVGWMLFGILGATAFYVAIAMAVGRALPWRRLVGADFPAAVAFQEVGGLVFAKIVIATALISLLKTWTAIAWMASRLLVAQAREGLLPSFLCVIDPRTGAPINAVVVTTAGSLLGLSAGRGALSPILNMASICQALTILLCLIGLLRLRRSSGASASYSVPNGVIVCALVSASLMIGAAVIAPVVRANGRIPPEWLLLAVWGGLGLVFSGLAVRRMKYES
jgi:APA family basic amino acid/polyamine antiporter